MTVDTKPILQLKLLVITLLLALGAEAIAQDGQQEAEAAAEEQATTTENRDLVFFVDIPFVYAAGTDPILPVLEGNADPELIIAPEQRLQSIAEYEASVQEIEAQGGAWDVELIESLTALGDLQQAQGNHL